MQARLLPYSPERDVYRLLGVPPTASIDEINAACRTLARTFHPDLNRSDRATAEMQVVNAVRSLMTDPDARSAYDRERWRFHSGASRSAVASRAREPMPTPMPMPVPRATWERYAIAARVGLRALLLGLAPPRCRRCRIVVEREDSYCVACGTPLLEGS